MLLLSLAKENWKTRKLKKLWFGKRFPKRCKSQKSFHNPFNIMLILIGIGRRECHFYEELSELLGGRPSVQPVAVAPSFDCQTEAAWTHDDDDSSTTTSVVTECT